MVSQRKYAISMVSLLPLSWGPGGLERASRFVAKRGMWLQALPIFGADILSLPPFPILSMERAWNENADDFAGAVGRSIFGQSPKGRPTLMDFLIFGPGHKRRFEWLRQMAPRAIVVSHERLVPYLEAHPELASRTCEPIQEWLRRSQVPLVIDTYHVRRPGANGENPILEDGMAFLHELVVHGRVGMIHFQPRRGTDELARFVRGAPTELEDILYALRNAGPVPLVIEVSPLSLMRYTLGDIRYRIHEILDFDLPISPLTDVPFW